MLVDKACVAGEDMAECESIQVPDGNWRVDTECCGQTYVKNTEE